MIKINLTCPLNFLNVAVTKCRVTYMAHSASVGQSSTEDFLVQSPQGGLHGPGLLYTPAVAPKDVLTSKTCEHNQPYMAKKVCADMIELRKVLIRGRQESQGQRRRDNHGAGAAVM